MTRLARLPIALSVLLAGVAATSVVQASTVVPKVSAPVKAPSFVGKGAMPSSLSLGMPNVSRATSVSYKYRPVFSDVYRPQSRAVPELDPAHGAASLALLVGGLALMSARRRRPAHAG